MLHAAALALVIVGMAGFMICWVAAVFFWFGALFTDDDDKNSRLLGRFGKALLIAVPFWAVGVAGIYGVNAFGSG